MLAILGLLLLTSTLNSVNRGSSSRTITLMEVCSSTLLGSGGIGEDGWDLILLRSRGISGGSLEARFSLDAWLVAIAGLWHSKSALRLLNRRCAHRLVIAGIGRDSRRVSDLGSRFRLWIPRESGNLELGQLLLPTLEMFVSMSYDVDRYDTKCMHPMKLQNVRIADGCLLKVARDACQARNELASWCKFASGSPGIKPNTEGRPLAKMASNCAQAAAKPPTANC